MLQPYVAFICKAINSFSIEIYQYSNIILLIWIILNVSALPYNANNWNIKILLIYLTHIHIYLHSVCKQQKIINGSKKTESNFILELIWAKSCNRCLNAVWKYQVYLLWKKPYTYIIWHKAKWLNRGCGTRYGVTICCSKKNVRR